MFCFQIACLGHATSYPERAYGTDLSLSYIDSVSIELTLLTRITKIGKYCGYLLIQLFQIFQIFAQYVGIYIYIYFFIKGTPWPYSYFQSFCIFFS